MNRDGSILPTEFLKNTMLKVKSKMLEKYVKFVVKGLELTVLFMEKIEIF